EVGDLDGRVRVERRRVRRVLDGAGDRHDHPRGRVRAGVPAAAGGFDLRDPDAAREDPGRVAHEPGAAGGGSAEGGPAEPAAGRDRGDRAAVRQLDVAEPGERVGADRRAGTTRGPEAVGWRRISTTPSRGWTRGRSRAAPAR